MCEAWVQPLAPKKNKHTHLVIRKHKVSWAHGARPQSVEAKLPMPQGCNYQFSLWSTAHYSDRNAQISARFSLIIISQGLKKPQFSFWPHHKNLVTLCCGLAVWAPPALVFSPHFFWPELTPSSLWEATLNLNPFYRPGGKTRLSWDDTEMSPCILLTRVSGGAQSTELTAHKRTWYRLANSSHVSSGFAEIILTLFENTNNQGVTAQVRGQQPQRRKSAEKPPKNNS